MREYFDLHVNFEWKEYKQEGYSKVFLPNIISEDSMYYEDKINIAIPSKNLVPQKYDLVFFQDYTPNIELFAKVSSKGKAVELNLNHIKQTILKGKIHKIRFFCKTLVAYRVPYVFTSGANNAFEVKSPKEIAFAGEFLGFTQKQVMHSMSATARNILQVKGWL